MEFLHLLSFGSSGWGDELMAGLGVTLALSFAAFPLAVALSFLIHWAKSSSLASVRMGARIYATVFKSVPEILTLLILYYQSQTAVNWILRQVSLESNFSMSPFLAGLIALSFVISAYGSEVVRAALNAVGRGQFEAARSLGLSRFDTFLKVILPQLWRHAIPGFGNLWVILLKDTSLLSVIAQGDLTSVASAAINTTRKPFFFYLVIAAIYVALVMLSWRAQRQLEESASRGFLKVDAAHA
jgi:polar amino acid transport system permease protein